MKTSNTLTIFVTPLKGEEIRIKKACTLKQAVTLAKKEARKLINNGGMWVTINIQTRVTYGVETLAHIEAEKQGRRVAFSDEQPAETYAVCWGDEYKEENGESNAIAEVSNEEEAKEIAENESESNSCVMSVVRNSDRKVIANYNNTPETPNPDNTPATMNANETISAAIIAELNTRKDRSAWDKGVTEYATELAESLDNWDKQPESVAELNEMMLNGADDWKAYSYGGSALIYNQDIAERLCSPSELKRVTNKSGLRDYPNSREHWLDVQARALYQAANRVAAIANKFLNA